MHHRGKLGGYPHLQAAGLAALVAGAALAWFGGSLFQVAVLCCAVVFAVNMFF